MSRTTKPSKSSSNSLFFMCLCLVMRFGMPKKRAYVVGGFFFIQFIYLFMSCRLFFSLHGSWTAHRTSRDRRRYRQITEKKFSVWLSRCQLICYFAISSDRIFAMFRCQILSCQRSFSLLFFSLSLISLVASCCVLVLTSTLNELNFM